MGQIQNLRDLKENKYLNRKLNKILSPIHIWKELGLTIRNTLPQTKEATDLRAFTFQNIYEIAGTCGNVMLRHYARIRKITGSIFNEVIGFFNRPDPSSRTMALESTQLLTKISIMNIPGGKERPAHKADNHKMWKTRRLTTLWASSTCYRSSFTFLWHCFRRKII
jgi:hypothetical protein